MDRPQLLAFDVNETLLDLAPLLRRVDDAVGAPAGEWLVRTLHGSLVANEVGWYRPFDVIGVEALVGLARRRGLTLSAASAREVVETMYRLPIHLDVYNAMERLFDAGFSMVALTNNSTAAANAQIENAGLHVFLQRVISVEEIELFKPAAEVYIHTAKVMEVAPRSMMMIAAHDWDCAGAMASGARAALVRRQGLEWAQPGPGPELVVDDMTALADTLVAHEMGQ